MSILFILVGISVVATALISWLTFPRMDKVEADWAEEKWIDPQRADQKADYLFLRSLHLDGVAVDDEQFVTAETRQAEWLVTASVSLLALATSAVVFASDPPKFSLLDVSRIKHLLIVDLLVALCAFSSYAVLAIYRRRRVDRRYNILRQSTDHLIFGSRPIDHAKLENGRRAAFLHEHRVLWMARLLKWLALFLFSSVTISLAIFGFDIAIK